MEITAGAAVFFPLLFYLDDSGIFAALIPAVFFHEIGHCISARIHGKRILSLRISLSGLCLETTPFHSSAEEALCAAAGPVCGLIWSAVCTCFHGGWWERSGDISLYFSACNLLPAHPLDGGRILCAFCNNRTILRGVSICTGTVCLAAAVYTRRWGLIPPAVWILSAQLIP